MNPGPVDGGPLSRHVALLEAALVEGLRDGAPDGPVFCLCLRYMVDTPLLPEVFVGREEDRAVMLAEEPDPRTVWDPTRWPPPRADDPGGLFYIADIEADLRTWSAAEEALNELKTTSGWDAWRGGVHDVLTHVCRRLMERDREGWLETTDDFVAYWTDHDLDHLHEGITRSAPPAILALPEDRGLLPDPLVAREPVPAARPLDSTTEEIPGELAERLPAAIVAAVAAAPPTEPVFCLALRYTEDVPFPPGVFLGRASDREAVLAGIPWDLRPAMAWNHAEWPSVRAGADELDPIGDDAELERLCELANDRLARGAGVGRGAARARLLAAVVTRLLGHDWAARRP